jgi:SAM-dependent methyltransferase
MRPKPKGIAGDYGAWFKDARIAEAYPHRPPYPEGAIRQLVALAAQGAGTEGAPRAVLDLGCGTGDVARRLAPLVDRVDAVDFSAAMLAQGRRQAGGAHPHLRWIEAPAETAPLDPPYALATAGESLHWMAWDAVLPRLRRALAPGAVLALLNREWDSPPAVRERLRPIFACYGANRDYRPYDLVAELEGRGLLRVAGRLACGSEPWRPTLGEYLLCRHSQNGFSRTHMGAEAAAAFDAAVTDALAGLCRDGVITERAGRYELSVVATVVWGEPRPLPPTKPP